MFGHPWQPWLQPTGPIAAGAINLASPGHPTYHDHRIQWGRASSCERWTSRASLPAPNSFGHLCGPPRTHMPASLVAPPALAKPAFLSLPQDPRQQPGSERPEVRRRASESSLRPGIPGQIASELRPRSEVSAALDLLSACSLRPSSIPPAPARSASTVVKCETLSTEARSEPVHPAPQEQSMAMASPQSLKSTASSSPRHSPCLPFAGSFILRQNVAAAEVPSSARQGGNEAADGSARPSRPQQKQEMRRLAEAGRCAKDDVTSVSPARPEFHTDDTFSPVRLSPPISCLPCSPGESQDWSVLQVCRIDAGTQTATSERQSSDDGRLRDDTATGTLEDEVLWFRSRNLPACISALAIQDEEATANPSQSHCLRKLEVRVASCWRQTTSHGSSLKGSEHSSLQLSSTQSPTSTSARENIGSEGSATDRCRVQHTPTDSFSSVSSPLDSMSLLKDLEMPSPQCVREQKDDFSRLPVQDLQRRAEALTQKLQHREHQCMVLREALEACNNRFKHALRPEMAGTGQKRTRA